MRLEFAVEPFETVLPAIQYYQQQHAEEVKKPFGVVSVPIYRAMADSGLLVAVTARGPDKIIYGYNISVVCPALHEDIIVAETKLIFIDPMVRGTNWIRMDKFVRQALRDRGAKRLYTGLRIARHVRVFARLGYRQVEMIMEIDLWGTS